MKIFVDSAKISEIGKAIDLGMCDGVTTNPSLIKKAMVEAGTEMEEYIRNICQKVGEGKSVSLEVISTSTEGMVREAKILHNKFNPIMGNIAIKIPVNTSIDGKNNHDGLKTISILAKDGISVNATLVMTCEQTLLAAKAGARYISPFAGRIDDLLREKDNKQFEKSDYFPANGIGQNDNGIKSGVELVKKSVEILKKHNLASEVIAASLRNPRQVREVALVGAHIATIPFNVIEDMLKHHKTSEGIKKFTEDVVEEYRELVR